MTDVAEEQKPATRQVMAWVFKDGSIRKAEQPSQQLPEDPFTYGKAQGESGLRTPPYDLDQLAQMLETNPLHYRACKQKAADVIGRGIDLRARELEGNAKPAAEQEATWHAFVQSVEDDDRPDTSPQGAFKTRLQQAHEDFESIGWGIVEVSRNTAGLPDGLWHVPSHTVRAHSDGRRFAQKRAGKTVWFKRFGMTGDVDRKDGGWSDKPLPKELRGNELIVERNYTPRSSFYGLPDHIPAMPALAGWRAQAEFNVRFFDNHAVPSYAVVIEGADITPALEELIKLHFRTLKGEPHSTLILAVPGASGDEAAAPKVRFERLSVDVKDASFRLYKQDNALEICIAHGIPPYRVGWPLLGSLGGATAEEMTQIYNDSIVQPRQETWEQRLTRSLLGAKGLAITDWELKLKELDTRNEARDIEKARGLYDLNVTTPNDSARFFGYDQRTDPLGGLTRDQLLFHQGELGGFAPATIAKRWSEEVGALTKLREQVAKMLGAETEAEA